MSKFVAELVAADAHGIARMSVARLRELYMAKAHAVQSGVAMMVARDRHYADGPPSTTKHLRTGIDTAKAEAGGLATLLIAKGLITEQEYYLAMLDGVAAEVERYEAELQQLYGGGTKVTLA